MGLGVIYVDALVVSGVSVAPRVVHPKIKSLVNQPNTNRTFSSCDDAYAAVDKSMLIQYYRFSFDNLLIFLTWDSPESVDIPIFGHINMLFKPVSKLILYKSPRGDI